MSILPSSSKFSSHRRQENRKSRVQLKSEQVEARMLLTGDLLPAADLLASTSTENNPPAVAVPIDDIAVNENSSPRVIDLSQLFSDADVGTANDTLTIAIENNSAPALVSPLLTGHELSLTFLPDQVGSAVITLKATDSLGAFAEFDFEVHVRQTGSVLAARLSPISETNTLGTVIATPLPNATVHEWQSGAVEIWYTIGSDTPQAPFDFEIEISASAEYYEEPSAGDFLATNIALATTEESDSFQSIVTLSQLDLTQYQLGETVLIGTLVYPSNESNPVGVRVSNDGTYSESLDDAGFRLQAARLPQGEVLVYEPLVPGKLATVTYDPTEDGSVGLADFALFVSNFGKATSPDVSHLFEGTAAEFDYDRDGKVGLSDFSWFARHFGMAKPHEPNIRMPGLTVPGATPPETVVTIDSLTIPVLNAVDQVYDPVQDVLYITTSSGNLERWSYASQRFLPPIEDIANMPSGLDVSADGKFVYIGEGASGNNQGTVWKVDLTSGTQTAIHFTLNSREDGVYDLAIASNGKLLLTMRYSSFSQTTIREIDLSTDVVQSRWQIVYNTKITRGADRSILLFQDTSYSINSMFTYHADTDDFTTIVKDAQRRLFDVAAAVSPDSSQFAYDGSLLSTELTTEGVTNHRVYGLTFSESGNLLYGIERDTDEVLVFKANDFSLLRRFDIGGDAQDLVDVSISDDGNVLFVNTTSGIRQLLLESEEDIEAPQAEITGTGLNESSDTLQEIQITFNEPVQGVTANDFVLTRNDSSNLLTGQATVTTIDNGTTWIISLDTQITSVEGTYWVTLQAENSGITDLSGNLLFGNAYLTWQNNTNAADALRLPFDDAIDQVYDPTSGILYFTTPDGSLNRWDTQSQTVLESFHHIAASPKGLDVSVDGQFALVGEGGSGGTQGIVWKVDLTDGSKSAFNFEFGDRYERGVYDLAITADGKAFFSTTRAGSGFLRLREIDLTTGLVTDIRSAPQESSIVRSADYSRLFFQGSNNSSGPIWTYDANSSTLSAEHNTGWYIGSLPDAISRDGTVIAFLSSLYDPDSFSIEATGFTNVGAYAFDPERDILYVADTASDEIVAYDSNNQIEIKRFEVPADLASGMTLNVTGSNGHLFANTSNGLWQVPIAIPLGDATPPHAEILDLVPKVRSDSLDSLTIYFTEPVTGVTPDDFLLSREGGANLIDENVTTRSTDDGHTWVLENLGSLTTTAGQYMLRLRAEALALKT